MVAFLKTFAPQMAWAGWLLNEIRGLVVGLPIAWAMGGLRAAVALVCASAALMVLSQLALRRWTARRAYRAAVTRRLAWA